MSELVERLKGVREELDEIIGEFMERQGATTKKKSPLKECPNCGNNPVATIDTDMNHWAYCPICRLSGPKTNNYGLSVALWNKLRGPRREDADEFTRDN